MILTDRKFWPLFWTQFLGALNDNFLKNAMVILVEYRGLRIVGFDPPTIVALAGGVFILPFFLFSMLAGQISDKFEKSRLVRIVKSWELLITLVASFGFYYHSIGLLLGALFMMGMHSTLFGPVKYSALPDLVKPELLVKANAYVELGTFLAILFGTIGGGVLILLPNGEIWISVALNVCALLGLLTCWQIHKLPSVDHNLKIRFKPIAPLIDLAKLLRRQTDLFHSIIGISSFWFFGASILAILPPYCKEYLHADGHVVTAFLAMFTVGIGTGCLLCERLSNRKVELGLVPIGTLGITIFTIDFSQVQHAVLPATAGFLRVDEFLSMPYGPHMLIDFFLMSVAGGFFILPLYTLLQARCEPQFRSRVIAGNNVFNAIFMVVSALMIMGLHMLHFSLPNTILIVVAVNALFSVYMYIAFPEFIRRLKGIFLGA